MPLLLKPEGLSRSTQITSLRLCICFQFRAINQASLGMFLSIFLFSSVFLFPSPFSFLLCLTSSQSIVEHSRTWSFFMCHWNQNNVEFHHMFVFFLGWPTSEETDPLLLIHSGTSVISLWSCLQDETAKKDLKMPAHARTADITWVMCTQQMYLCSLVCGSVKVVLYFSWLPYSNHLKSAFIPCWNECFPCLLAPVCYKSWPCVEFFELRCQ